MTTAVRFSSRFLFQHPPRTPAFAVHKQTAFSTFTRTTQRHEIHKSSAGTGNPKGAGDASWTKDRGPVSWTSLFLVGVAAASAVAYYRIERERRLEAAMGRVVSSESDGWTPRPDYLAKRKFIPTRYGWFPQEDGFGARECVVWLVGLGVVVLVVCLFSSWRFLVFSHASLLSLRTHTAGKPAIGGPWSLVDLEGNLVTNKSFEGKWLLVRRP